MRFTKMQGAGNDYVYVNCFQEPVPANLPELAQRISDRHFGVGGDGLVLICPSQQADARMRMFNADGSEAEMCGNAIRCVAKYVYEHEIARKPVLKIETGNGVLTLELQVTGGKVERVRVNMGQPILEPGKIPVSLPDGAGMERIVNHPIAPSILLDRFAEAGVSPNWRDEAGLDPRMTCVSMGNPHAVLYCRDVQKIPLAAVGPWLETQPVFPRRINVHFVQVHSPSEVTMRTWERGSGVTLACGTGAAAVCVAGALSGNSGRKILAHLPGGDLELEWAADNHVFKTGPAVEVFSAEWNP